MEPRILIVIPAHNEQGTIDSVIRGLRREAPGFDRLVVDDGSTDETPEILARLGEHSARLSFNLGYGYALQTGLTYALATGYDIVVLFDGDGQHRPQDVPRIVERLIRSKADLVIGSRFCGGRPYTGPLARRVAQRVFSWISRLFVDRRIYDTTSGFKGLSVRACHRLVRGSFLDFHVEAIVRLGLHGQRINELPIEVDERRAGTSMYSWSRAVEYPVRTLALTLLAAVEVLRERGGSR
jgi:glycosyltransferase involved in cell wall biosynthesis